MRKKTLAIALAVIAIVSVVTTGTLAWLSAQTDPITNTFSPSTIGLELEETTGADYKMVPGATIAKNPTVTVTAGSEACYVFVQITENLGAWANVESHKAFSELLKYTVDSAWTALPNVSGVYYMLVAANENADQEFHVLADDEIVVSGVNVTKEYMDKLYKDNGDLVDNLPTLSFTAYAIQSANLPGTGANDAATPAEAWALASAQGNQ